MYSVVLLMAVTVGSESADFGRRGGCHGCWGCKGCSGCCGYSSCCGGCSGCCGYSSCCGGCCGVTYGCCGVTYGCCGTVVTEPASPPEVASPPKTVENGAKPAPKTPEALNADETKWLKEMTDYFTKNPKDGDAKKIEADFKAMDHEGRKKAYKEFSESEVLLRTGVAQIVVSVPADASVTVDGKATVSTSTVRTFETPTLTSDKTYSYTFKAEFSREGKTVTVSKKVTVKAGKIVNLDLNQADALVASR
jgi:uncharacterized protein (TIGR03000 family)